MYAEERKIRDNMQTKIEKEMQSLRNIIKKCEKLKGECEHEKGELYALNWVLGMMEGVVCTN